MNPSKFTERLKRRFPLKDGIKKDLILSLYCLPGILIIYIIGAILGDFVHASIAAGGALTAGFGANKKILKYPFTPMIIAVTGMGVAVWAGSLLGHYPVIYVLFCMILASLCALVSLIDQNAWWILVQWCIAVFVAGYYAGNFNVAMERSLLILSGGGFQIICIIFFLRKLSFHRNILEPRKIARIIKNIHENIDKKIRFNTVAIYSALSMLLCFIFVYTFKLEYNYWAMMTTLLVLKTDFKNTLDRAKERLIGTLLGVLIATGLTFLGTSHLLLVLEIIISIFITYTVLNQSYSILTTFITITAVLMFSVNGVPEVKIAMDRIIATMVGGGSALAIMTLSHIFLKIIRFSTNNR